MRELLKKAFIAGASAVSSPKAGVYIMNGHFLSRAANDDVEVFDRQLGYLSKMMRFISIEDATKMVLSREALDIDETLVAFTFDDGFDDNLLALAPALEKFGVNACCFVNPGFVDGDEGYISQFTENVVLTPGKRPMSWDQIRQLHDRGFVIGNHTYDHVRLSAVKPEEAEAQVVNAKHKIASELNCDCDYFAWPFGQYADVNDDVIEMLLKHHKYVYSGCDYQNYTSFGGRVLNRRHFEADWPGHEVKYFLSRSRAY